MKIEDVFMRAHIGASIGFTPPDSQTTRERHAAPSAHHEVCVQQIRSATVKVSYGETTFLVDPMLAPAKAYPGFKLTYRNHLSWPFCDLPVVPAFYFLPMRMATLGMPLAGSLWV